MPGAAPHTPKLVPYGDAALLIKYNAQGYDEGVMRTVQNLAESLRTNGYWRDVITGYDSVLVSFDPLKSTMEEAARRLTPKLTYSASSKKPAATLIDIPVVYGGRFGPDMHQIMKSSGLTQDAVIAAHSGQEYQVCMMGFIPGFAFLSAAPQALHHPRHDIPRSHVPAGSVGIAGWQTGIYGLESPGGWQIIGRTPLSMFDKTRDNPFYLTAGDRVRFIPTASGGFND